VIAKIRAAFVARSGSAGGGETESAIGLVPNLAASRIANRLDLRGPAYTIDAACASSLLAIDQGCRELADRRCDASSPAASRLPRRHVLVRLTNSARSARPRRSAPSTAAPTAS